MIQKKVIDFPLKKEFSIAIKKEHNLGLTSDKIMNYFLFELKDLHYNEMGMADDHTIAFINNKPNFLVNRYKNQLAPFNYGELTLLETDDYWVLEFKAELKRLLIISACVVVLIALFSAINGAFFNNQLNLSLLTPLKFGLFYFAISYFGAGYRIKRFLIRKKIHLETWGNKPITPLR